MELLVLVPTIVLLVIYIAYKEWLNIAYRQWLDLFKRRLAAYEQLKIAVAPVRASGAVSNTDTDRFAQAMSDMRFLFDKDLERFISGIYDALLKNYALDALLEKVALKRSSYGQRSHREVLRPRHQPFFQVEIFDVPKHSIEITNAKFGG